MFTNLSALKIIDLFALTQPRLTKIFDGSLLPFYSLRICLTSNDAKSQVHDESKSNALAADTRFSKIPIRDGGSSLIRGFKIPKWICPVTLVKIRLCSANFFLVFPNTDDKPAEEEPEIPKFPALSSQLQLDALWDVLGKKIIILVTIISHNLLL